MADPAGRRKSQPVVTFPPPAADASGRRKSQQPSGAFHLPHHSRPGLSRRSMSATAAPRPKLQPRSKSFANSRWEPTGPTLALRKSSVAGPFGFLNPTTAIFDIKSNEEAGGSTTDLADITSPTRGTRAKVKWNARDYRKGRHVLVLPKKAPLTSRLRRTSKPQRVLIGISRMFTMFPYWDVSWLIGISFTIGCMLFIVCGFFYWLPISHPELTFKGEKWIAGGLCAFIGATLFQIGAVLLFLESYNDRAETKFGHAMEELFVDKLGIARRVRNHRPKHFDFEHLAETGLSVDDDQLRPMPDSNDTTLRQTTTSGSSGSGSGSGAGSSSGSHSPVSVHSVDGPSQQPAAPTRNLGHQFDPDHPFAERDWQWLPSWEDVRTHYIYEIGFLASFTMSVGATIFYICGILALPGILQNLSKPVKDGVYYVPYLVGGILFWISSILYVLETQPNWYTPQPFKIGWHVGVWNMIGGIGWTLAASLGFPTVHWAGYQSELALIWASIAFSIGSALQWYESLDKYVIIVEDDKDDSSSMDEDVEK